LPEPLYPAFRKQAKRRHGDSVMTDDQKRFLVEIHLEEDPEHILNCNVLSKAFGHVCREPIEIFKDEFENRFWVLCQTHIRLARNDYKKVA
jgi:hypothetical protein